ncbi:hypothetical protein D3C78_1148550 [compost metagenome]
MDEVPAPVRNPLVQTTDQLGQLPVAVRATGFPRPLALQVGQPGQRLAQPARVVDGRAVVEVGPVLEAKVDAGLVVARALARTGLRGHPQGDRGGPLVLTGSVIAPAAQR